MLETVLKIHKKMKKKILSGFSKNFFLSKECLSINTCPRNCAISPVMSSLHSTFLLLDFLNKHSYSTNKKNSIFQFGSVFASKKKEKQNREKERK